MAKIDSPPFFVAPPGLRKLFMIRDPALTCCAKFFGSPSGFGLFQGSHITPDFGIEMLPGRGAGVLRPYRKRAEVDTLAMG